MKIEVKFVINKHDAGRRPLVLVFANGTIKRWARLDGTKWSILALDHLQHCWDQGDFEVLAQASDPSEIRRSLEFWSLGLLEETPQ